MPAPPDCWLASDSSIPTGSSPCNRYDHKACRKPWGFLPGAFRIRGSAVSAALNATSDSDIGWLDGSFVEVAHTSRCGVEHCDRGVWFYSARGCSGLLWNVGRSLRAMNKLHAHALLAGERATCELVASQLQGLRRPLLLRRATEWQGKQRTMVAWLDHMHNDTNACSHWIVHFSNRSYAVEPDGGSTFDPFTLVGSSLFDTPLVHLARRSGYDSVQFALQPGGATKKTNGYVDAGGSTLEVEFLDVRDGRYSCEIESDPSRLLPHMRVVRPAAARSQISEQNAGPCRPTTHFYACMACEGVRSGCMTHAAMRKERHPLLRRRMADANWTAALLSYVAHRQMSSAAERWTFLSDHDAAVLFHRNLSMALSTCPLARDEVRESIVTMLKGMVSSRCGHKPCDVVRAIRAFPNRASWPIDETVCGSDHHVRCQWRSKALYPAVRRPQAGRRKVH